MTTELVTLEQATAIAERDALQAVIKLVTDGLDSPHSRRAYGIALRDFLTWRESKGAPAMTKALVAAYKRHLATSGLAASTINLRLSAVRKFLTEAADNGLVATADAASIARVRGVKAQGVRSGTWLTLEQAQAVLDAPDVATVKGLRDRAILAVLLGAGLRRSECAALEIRHMAERDGRPCLVDLVGKGNRVRTVPVAPWVWAALQAWITAAGITAGPVFLGLRKNHTLTSRPLTPQNLLLVVREYAPAGLELAPHDLRRTFAKLSYAGGAALDQVSLSLGHASLQTTERYLGLAQQLGSGAAPSDRIGLHVGRTTQRKV